MAIDRTVGERTRTVAAVDLVTRRRSKLAPPPRWVSDALTGHLRHWWVSVDGEQEPAVVNSDTDSLITWSSPFRWRPRDRIELRLEPGPYDTGCVLELRHTSSDPFHPREASTIRHRWGEHLDRDLRDFLDDGSTKPYRFSCYRGDVADWSILESVEDQMWTVTSPLWARSEIQLAPGRSWMAVLRVAGGEHLLVPGTVLWSFALCRHQSGVRCLAAQPDQVQDRVLPNRGPFAERYRGFELVVAVAAFGRELEAMASVGPTTEPG